MGVVWCETGSLLHQISFPCFRGRIRPHPESRSVRRLAAQIHNRAATRSRQEVFQPPHTACLSHICKLVEWTPRFCGRRTISKQNERPYVRSTGRNLVVTASFRKTKRLGD